MANMREIRKRITSVQKTMKITNAMYLLASSKLKRARNYLKATEPYFEKLQDTMTEIVLHTGRFNQKYFGNDQNTPEEERKHGYIIITSDKGLAGSYNHNVIKLAEESMAQSKSRFGSKMLFVGHAGRNYFRKKSECGCVDEDHCYAAMEPTLWLAREIGECVMDAFLSGELDVIHVVYTKMRNALAADAEIIEILPLTQNMFHRDVSGQTNNYLNSFQPSPEAVFKQIVPNYVKGIIYGAMTESYAAEQNARMAAMDNATKNAKEIVRKLSLQYNRVRQGNITTEITEVVSGANVQN